MDHTSSEPPHPNVLLVEDSPADAELAVIAIQQSRPDAKIHVVDNGEAALQYLHDQRHADRAASPDLVLLDLNLPGRDGIEILQVIKADADLRHLPVIMFSNSNARSDVAAAYEHGANAYLLKPMEYAEIKEAMGDLVRFWWDRAQLPMTSATTTSA